MVDGGGVVGVDEGDMVGLVEDEGDMVGLVEDEDVVGLVEDEGDMVGLVEDEGDVVGLVEDEDVVGLVEDEDDLEDEDGGIVGFVEKDGFVVGGRVDEEDGFKDPVAGGWGAGDTTGFAAATGAATEATAAAGATAAITGFTSTGEDSAAANLGFGAGLVGAGLGAADFAEDGFDTDLPPFDRSTGE